MQYSNLIKFFIILLGGLALGFVVWGMMMTVNNETEKIAKTFPALAGAVISHLSNIPRLQKR